VTVADAGFDKQGECGLETIWNPKVRQEQGRAPLLRGFPVANHHLTPVASAPYFLLVALGIAYMRQLGCFWHPP
jgi:hypothetical protein